MNPRAAVVAIAFCFSFQLAIGQVDTLTILHLNDTHSNLAPIGPRSQNLEGSLGGIARAASLIGLQKASNPNPLLLHAGDAFVGDLFYNVYFGVPELQIMQMLGFDAMAVGNHEFDLTPAALHGALQTAFAEGGFPLLSANLILDDPAVDSLKLFIKPYTIVQSGNIKVGIFGMTTPSTNTISQPSPAVVDTNIVQIASSMVDTLKAQGCQVVLCLSHLGFTLDALVATYVPGIHGIVGGHDHFLFPEPVFVENVSGDSTWILQASSFYLHLGKMRLTVEGSNVRFLDYEMLEIADPIPQEPTIASSVNELIGGIEAAYGQPFYTQQVGVVGEYLEEFDQFPLMYGTKDTPLGNLVTDVFRSVTGADIAIEANGSIAQPLYGGPVVAADVYRAVGYGFNEDNFLGYRLVTFDIAGQGLLAGLEYGLSTLHFNDDFLVQVSGMSYVYDPMNPEFERLVDVKVGDAPLNPAATYTVAANEFVKFFLDVLQIPYDNLHIYRDTTEFQVLLAHVMSVDTVRAQSEGRVKADKATSAFLATNDIPAAFELHQNYPNPFNPSTIIMYDLSERAHVVLKVYDLLGREIATLVDGIQDIGSRSVRFDASKLAAGVYFYRLNAGSIVQTKRMLLLK
ncbi:MAG: 5'-nucleotidase C-terminal domain-containing protein [Ignavibacteriales bacterium]|nr:5'-nucleotidase C-terminal domain-containing protein [Ignavibacteriales bacterium]